MSLSRFPDELTDQFNFEWGEHNWRDVSDEELLGRISRFFRSFGRFILASLSFYQYFTTFDGANSQILNNEMKFALKGISGLNVYKALSLKYL